MYIPSTDHSIKTNGVISNVLIRKYFKYNLLRVVNGGLRLYRRERRSERNFHRLYRTKRRQLLFRWKPFIAARTELTCDLKTNTQ